MGRNINSLGSLDSGYHGAKCPMNANPSQYKFTPVFREFITNKTWSIKHVISLIYSLLEHCHRLICSIMDCARRGLEGYQW